MKKASFAQFDSRQNMIKVPKSATDNSSVGVYKIEAILSIDELQLTEKYVLRIIIAP